MTSVIENESATDAFMQRVTEDSEVRAKFSTLVTSQEISDFARTLGLDFTAEEYEASLDAMLETAYDGVPGAARMSGVSQCPTRWPT